MRLRGQQLNKPLLAARRAEDCTLFYSPIQHVIPPSRQIDSSGASHPHILLFPAVHGKTFRVLYRRDPQLWPSSALASCLLDPAKTGTKVGASRWNSNVTAVPSESPSSIELHSRDTPELPVIPAKRFRLAAALLIANIIGSSATRSWRRGCRSLPVASRPPLASGIGERALPLPGHSKRDRLSQGTSGGANLTR